LALPFFYGFYLFKVDLSAGKNFLKAVLMVIESQLALQVCILCYAFMSQLSMLLKHELTIW